jgi:general stress protein 26
MASKGADIHIQATMILFHRHFIENNFVPGTKTISKVKSLEEEPQYNVESP